MPAAFHIGPPANSVHTYERPNASSCFAFLRASLRNMLQTSPKTSDLQHEARLFNTTPHHTAPHHTTPHHTTPRHTALHHATSHHATSHHTTQQQQKISHNIRQPVTRGDVWMNKIYINSQHTKNHNTQRTTTHKGPQHTKDYNTQRTTTHKGLQHTKDYNTQRTTTHKGLQHTEVTTHRSYNTQELQHKSYNTKPFRRERHQTAVKAAQDSLMNVWRLFYNAMTSQD